MAQNVQLIAMAVAAFARVGPSPAVLIAQNRAGDATDAFRTPTRTCLDHIAREEFA